MRHQKNFNHLSRKSAHRDAMLSNMANSLILHKRIKTTTAKAKALRTYIEPLITKSKEDTTHSRRIVFSYLKNKEAVNELFREVSTKIASRPGGYTRILKLGKRLGDSADMCIIELVDYNELMLAAKDESTQKTGRKRRRRKSSAGEKTGASEPQVKDTQETAATEDISEEVIENAAAEPETDQKTKTDASVREVKEEETKTDTEEAASSEEVKDDAQTDAEKQGDEKEKQDNTESGKKEG